MAWDSTEAPRRVDECVPGFYLVRFRKGAMAVACRIIRWEDGMWQTVVGGETRDAMADWVHLRDIDYIRFGKRITEQEYGFWLERAEFAKRHAPDHPAANPTMKVDWRKMKP